VDFLNIFKWIEKPRRLRETVSRREFQAVLLLGILTATPLSARAQEPALEPPPSSAQDQGQTAQPMTLDRTLATLRGVVRNAATGEGLPRALVRIEGDANAGALTDGEGRFEIPGIPVGPQSVSVAKPGFLDRGFSSPGAANEAEQFLALEAAGSHNILVAAQMPDVVFTLAPKGAIRGQVELSTGDPGEGIAIALAKRTVQDGRAVWQQAVTTKTRGDGTYRFGGLADGEYALFTEPALESDLERVRGGSGPRWGYASVYYPDAREPSGAARIHVANGQETQDNLTLTLEAFQTVTAAVVFPQGSSAQRAGMGISTAVLDSAGRQLPYLAEYDEQSHAVQAVLPDGTYTLLVSVTPQMERREGQGNPNTGVLAGSVEVAVAGHAVPNLRLPLSAARPSPVQVTVRRDAGAPVTSEAIEVLVSQAGGWIDDSMISDYARGSLPGPLEATYVKPGSYWVRWHGERGLCEASFTAGGASLAREPVVIGLSGSAAPMELTLRDDCANLELSLPEALQSTTAGEEPFFTVYVVPDFDSTLDLGPMTLRPSSGGTMTLNGLSPGNYHVYTFLGTVNLEYKNRAALATLANRGQAIALSPGATGNLVVEAPE
jgi:hypothetical protein